MTTQSTVIVSIYNDINALELILTSLISQSTRNFDVIISEDAAHTSVEKFINQCNNLPFHLTHLTQKDDGFRKNIALNRAIKTSNNDHLIFIDGDCVLHPEFVKAHQSHYREGIMCTGRRLELGESFSSKLRNNERSLSSLTNRFFYITNLYTLLRDRAKNIESGLYSKTIHYFTKNRKIRLLGCNFSCHKKDLIKINGFNQDYLSPGIGEDSDIDWRLSQAGIKTINVKFSAIQYHLFHERRYNVSDRNKALFEETKKSEDYRCINGLDEIR